MTETATVAAVLGRMSPNLELNQNVAERRADGDDIVHLGFGEARLPVFGPFAQALAAGARHNAYGPVNGAPRVREAVAGYFTRRGLPTEAPQVITAPGSKPILTALQLVLPGDTVIPAPAWNSYRPQAELAGKRVLPVPIPEACGGVPDPERLREIVREARRRGADPRTVIVTLPDNPTGTVASPETVRELCAVAEQEDLVIVSDEIYRDLVHDPATPVLSPAEVAPHRTIVTTGLSKTLALGGWRIGAARFPAGDWGERAHRGVASVASEVWSTLAAPMQEVAAYAFDEPPEIRQRLAASARLHGAVARAVHGIMTDSGALCRPPTGGFYVYPDFEPVRGALAGRGVADSASLFQYLLDEHRIAVLAGHHLGDDPGALRFKAATSLLYGDTRELQQQALEATDPVRLPHVAAVLDRIRDCFAKLGA
ncbi:pyridoxal phosphate-dependent aminotransferase [Streptomyces sp. NPDC019531]|uniref:pyridoxal phosphate-dependent aminotransferase n=1 Tax=Streptomyces sp. NPDC019531 TaxID=3365062 RepID=UPI00384B383F